MQNSFLSLQNSFFCCFEIINTFYSIKEGSICNLWGGSVWKGDEVVVVTGEYRGAKGTVDVLVIVIDHSDGAEVGEMGGDRLGSWWDSGMVG